MLKNLFVAIVGGLILWFTQDYFRDVPTATYSISSGVEIPNSQGSAESAQEILVINSGRSAVKLISIKIPFRINSYKLTKHSNLIKEEIVSDANSFELVYPELPQGQKIGLLIRYNGSPISKSLISIGHANGIAQSQENQTSSISFWWLWMAFILGILSQSFGDIRRMQRASFLKWSDDEKLYRNDKPWFAFSKEWSEMQFEGIRKSIEKYDYSSIDQTICYKLLNRSKPALMSEDHWIKLQKLASEVLTRKLSNEVVIGTNTDKLIDLFKLNKPEALSHQTWIAFQDRLNSELQKNLLPTHISEAGFVRILEANNPTLKNLPEHIAREIQTVARQRYSRYLIDGSKYEIRTDPSVILSTARFDFLTDEEAELVRNTVNQLSRMKAMPSNWELIELKKFVSKNKPEWMRENEFKSIGDFVLKAESLSDEVNTIHQQQNDLKSCQLKTEKIMNRVIAQLALIDKVLTIPNTMEKIEDYDETFAIGNRKNLELVASLLKSVNHSENSAL